MPSVVKNGKGKFCSKECAHIALRQGETIVCQYCGKKFYVQKRSLKVGKGKYCSDKCARIARRKRKALKCLSCGKLFYTTESRNKKFCSRDCYAKWTIGKNHGRWRGGKLKTTCLQCGQSIMVYPQTLKQGNGKFCSRACFGKWNSEHKKGKKHPNYKGLTSKCRFCGKIFHTYECHLKNGKGKFCSKTCFDKWQTGENSPNWQGGVSFEPYCSKWNNHFREYIRNKFNNKCFICGKTEVENGRKLSVHHCNYSKDCLCNIEDTTCQFVPLCISCHVKTNHNRDYWEQFLMTKLRNRIDGYYI